jgi:hypothetical protein
MDDKKVILNKTEFDNMETELNNLRKVVESRTIVTIKTPIYNWGYIQATSSNYYEYIFGTDENEIVKEISTEIEKLKKEKGELNHIVNGLETKIRWFQSQQDEWKNLPWYKRLFV